MLAGIPVSRPKTDWFLARTVAKIAHQSDQASKALPKGGFRGVKDRRPKDDLEICASTVNNLVTNPGQLSSKDPTIS